MNGKGRPVVALDIDGTLGDYHGNFISFCKLYFGQSFVQPTVPNPGLPLWEFLDLSKRDYRDAKLAYRQGGWKRWMPAYEGAGELTRGIRSLGAELWICTTRPYLRLDNIDPDTREWFRRNQIEYDGLLFDPAHEEDGTKYHELVRQVGADRIASVADDLPEMIDALNALYIPKNSPPILRDQPYNRHYKTTLNRPVRRAHSCADLWLGISLDVRKWHAQR